VVDLNPNTRGGLAIGGGVNIGGGGENIGGGGENWKKVAKTVNRVAKKMNSNWRGGGKDTHAYRMCGAGVQHAEQC
jgi:hypothetical protein